MEQFNSKVNILDVFRNIIRKNIELLNSLFIMKQRIKIYVAYEISLQIVYHDIKHFRRGSTSYITRTDNLYAVEMKYSHKSASKTSFFRATYIYFGL